MLDDLASSDQQTDKSTNTLLDFSRSLVNRFKVR